MTAPVRVVFVDHASEAGGAELALVRLLRTQQDWHASLIVPSASNADADAFGTDLGDAKVIRRGPVHRARKAGRGGALGDAALAWRIVRSAIGLAMTPAARRADVIVANTTRASVYVALACIVLRKPFAVHIRDLIDPASVGGSATALMRKVVLPRAAAVIANSRASLATAEPHVRPSCVRLVLPSPSGLTVRAESEVVVSPAAKRIGMVARLDPWKGQELLIEAFARAFPEGDEQLVLFGGAAFGHDEFPDLLRRLASARGVGSRVELAGHVLDVAAAIDSLDICVQSSIRPEPLGQNVLQYLAAGKPTVVANEGGPTEWVRHDVNGLTFAARDASSLADVLRLMASDGELRSRLAHSAVSTPRLLSDAQVGAELHELVTRIAWGQE